MSDCCGSLLNDPHACEMDFTGKPFKGFLFISEAGYRTASDLTSWLDEAVECAKPKPPKNKKATMFKKLSKENHR
ncbi:MAG: hypothetical protein ABL950_00715 [Nitrospira sp.]